MNEFDYLGNSKEKYENNTETLEYEFNSFKENHMYNIIAATIIKYGNKALIKTIPVLEKYNYINAKDDYDNAIIIVDDLAENFNTQTYKDVYEKCLKRIRNLISDKKSYNLDADEN